MATTTTAGRGRALEATAPAAGLPTARWAARAAPAGSRPIFFLCFFSSFFLLPPKKIPWPWDIIWLVRGWCPAGDYAPSPVLAKPTVSAGPNFSQKLYVLFFWVSRSDDIYYVLYVVHGTGKNTASSSYRGMLQDVRDVRVYVQFNVGHAIVVRNVAKVTAGAAKGAPCFR